MVMFHLSLTYEAVSLFPFWSHLEHGQEGTRESSPVLEDMPLPALQRSKPQLKNTDNMCALHTCHGDDGNLIADVLDTVDNTRLILECDYCVANFISIFHSMSTGTIK